MKVVGTVAAILLAIPLIIFGANDFLNLFPLPPGDGSPACLLEAMHEGGLMHAIALSHVVAGLLLVIPRTRLLGALLQLPMSIGIVAFHVTMMPAGLGLAIVLLLLNVVAMAEPERLRSLVRSGG